ncbi:flagellar export chaperone FliS [Xenophilus arseniciresistens]|uniref:Flagellar secretion chaperone FliS n=1 Tax=Xenophilus arseniciresistens TaxID=1283306 RepID=A0AAE3SYX7_9BURK|nr:flagellar export chaperone FliS [Xenophilus arseniciresistens]MDA7415236.1 flagellar export chaperone FliS [Xenophilus arseniciresistens]
MYTPPSARAQAAYRNIAAQSSIEGATPHRLIELVFDGLLQSLRAARGALERGDLQAKGQQIGRAVRFLEEGLKGGLNDAQGGELAARLRALYDYCVNRLTTANLHNDAAALAEVEALIAPLAQGWRDIGPQAAAQRV